METMDLSEARIYVGTYAKYNEGSLRGKWIDLSDCYDQDEFMEDATNSTKTRKNPN